MLILLDLDGTLTNTIHPSWKPYKDGVSILSEENVKRVPIFDGVESFIASRRSKGDTLLVVSDSHPSYVNPICARLNLECVSLTDKPNTKKFIDYLVTKPNLLESIKQGGCIMIGDTRLDIELGRKLKIPTIWLLPYAITDEIKDSRDGLGDEMASKKMGPTYAANTFAEIETILNNLLGNLYSIESSFVGHTSNNSIRLSFVRYQNGSYACIRCLARQEQGVCDKFACADKYFMISNTQRTKEFLQTLAHSISMYIGQRTIMNESWDYLTYLTDKATTIPTNKMKEIFDLIDTSIPKVRLLKWADNVEGSLRNTNLYKDRRDFLEQYLQIDANDIILQNKNVIVIDDQLTTGATAWYVIQKLKSFGVKNILFIAMFQMVLPVYNDKICSRCGKPMLLKIRRLDGHRFYSCTPPQYGGDGCGYIEDIPEQ